MNYHFYQLFHFLFHVLIFYECICVFHHDNGTIGLIIHDINEYYFCIYQLLKLFSFIAIYRIWNNFFTYFATILRLHKKSQPEQVQHGKQIETPIVLTITRKEAENNFTTTRAFLFDFNNVYSLFRMAIILIFILCGISSQLTIININRSVYDDCNGDGCGLIGIFLVDVFIELFK